MTAFCSKPMFMSDIRETLMAAIGQKQAEAEDNILPAADSDFRDRRILLVEDNELNREICSSVSLVNMVFRLIQRKMEQRLWRESGIQARGL